MAVLPILTDEDPRLRLTSQAVEEITPEVLQLISDMKETLLAAKGMGLAAPQVGHNVRVFVVLRGSGIVAFINPTIIARQGSDLDKEGCLSLPGRWVKKERAKRIVVRAQNERGSWVQTEAKGFFARAIQHEIEHLEGILMTDGAPEEL